MKQCKHCQIDKLETEFGSAKNTKDKLNVWCRECQRTYSLAHYEKNKSKYNERRRALWKDKKI